MPVRPVSLTCALLAAVLAGCGGSEDGGDNRTFGAEQSGTTTTTRVEMVPAAPEDSSFDPRAIYKREAPGVVTIVSVFGGGNGQEGGQSGQGVGSGFVISAKGEIVTNAHVVTNGEGAEARLAEDVFVEFADRNKVPAEIVGHDPNADVALLRVDTAGLDIRTLPLGSSEDVEVGEPVAAIGSPFGERQSLSVGVVSAVNRSIRSLTAFEIPGAIQTDAAINPGNSGGPLVNSRGEVIGVNQQIRSTSGGGEGVGFAVPVDAVKRSIAQLREDGTVEYAYLGVSTVELYPQLVEHFDLPAKEGVWVQTVSEGGPAASAGLQGGQAGEEVRFEGDTYITGGDVLTKVGDQPVRDADDLALAVAQFRPGQKVTVQAWRDGQRRDLQVTLGERPEGAGDLP